MSYRKVEERAFFALRAFGPPNQGNLKNYKIVLDSISQPEDTEPFLASLKEAVLNDCGFEQIEKELSERFDSETVSRSVELLKRVLAEARRASTNPRGPAQTKTSSSDKVRNTLMGLWSSRPKPGNVSPAKKRKILFSLFVVASLLAGYVVRVRFISSSFQDFYPLRVGNYRIHSSESGKYSLKVSYIDHGYDFEGEYFKVHLEKVSTISGEHILNEIHWWRVYAGSLFVFKAQDLSTGKNFCFDPMRQISGEMRIGETWESSPELFLLSPDGSRERKHSEFHSETIVGLEEVEVPVGKFDALYLVGKEGKSWEAKGIGTVAWEHEDDEAYKLIEYRVDGEVKGNAKEYLAEKKRELEAAEATALEAALTENRKETKSSPISNIQGHVQPKSESNSVLDLARVSATRELTRNDLKSLSAKELTILRNAIYARHGRSFQDPALRTYFSSQSWYQVNPRYSDSLLNNLERKNATAINEFQRRNGLVW